MLEGGGLVGDVVEREKKTKDRIELTLLSFYSL